MTPPRSHWRILIGGLLATLVLLIGGVVWLAAGGAALPRHPVLARQVTVTTHTITEPVASILIESDAPVWAVELGDDSIFRVHTDGYIALDSPTATLPGWTTFPHIRRTANRVYIHQTATTATIWVNDERAGSFPPGVRVTIALPSSQTARVTVWLPAPV